MPLIKSINAPTTLQAFSMRDIEAHAMSVLAKAQKQAEQLLAAAQGEAEELKKQASARAFSEGQAAGLAKGLEDGKKTGHDQAVNETRAQLANLVKTLTASAAQLDASRQELLTQGIHDVVELAAGIARRVTKRQGLIEPAVLADNVADAMRLVVHAADVRIAIHPTQVKTLKTHLPALQVQWPNLKHVELTEDANVSPGGCRIHTAGGIVDADLDVQLDRVIDELLPSVDPPAKKENESAS